MFLIILYSLFDCIHFIFNFLFLNFLFMVLMIVFSVLLPYILGSLLPSKLIFGPFIIIIFFMIYFCLVGFNILKSLSPIINSVIFRHINLRGIYFKCDLILSKLYKYVILCIYFKCVLNVTIPYKQYLFDFVNYCSDTVNNCKSVNLFIPIDYYCIGYTTDGIALYKAIRNVYVFDCFNYYIFGTGGSYLSFSLFLFRLFLSRIKLVNRSKNNLFKVLQFLYYRKCNILNSEFKMCFISLIPNSALIYYINWFNEFIKPINIIYFYNINYINWFNEFIKFNFYYSGLNMLYLQALENNKLLCKNEFKLL